MKPQTGLFLVFSTIVEIYPQLIYPRILDIIQKNGMLEQMEWVHVDTSDSNSDIDQKLDCQETWQQMVFSVSRSPGTDYRGFPANIVLKYELYILINYIYFITRDIGSVDFDKVLHPRVAVKSFWPC